MGSDARTGAATLTGLVIEPAAEHDLDQVIWLERACYSDPWPDASFAALPDNPRVYFAVARQAGGARTILGYVVAWYVLDEGELANLAVTPSARGKGVGKALLAAALRDAEHRQAADVYLEVRESNVAAIGLYEGSGFERIGRRKGYYRHPVEDALVFRRRLEPTLR